MNLYRTFALTLVVIILASCQKSTILKPTVSEQPPPLPSKIQEVLQTTTFTPPATFMPTVSLQLLPKNILQYKCVDIAPNPPRTANLSGQLVLWGPQSFFFDFENRTFRVIPNKRGDFTVSPDGTWLAYYEVSASSPTGMWLTIENAEGQQKRVPMQPDWDWGIIMRWLDNRRFAYNIWDRNSITPIYPVVIIDPFTGVTQELASDYPNLKPKVLGMAGTPHFIYSTVVYDSSLDLVIYPETNSEGDFVVLWDRQNQKALAKLRDLNNFSHTPLWLPDGSQFVVAIRNTWENDEWFSINREGEIHQLTQFGNFLTHTDIESSSISPNGRYLAFWMQVEPSSFSGYNLAILDLETHFVTDYCIPGSSGATGEPIWSPDSQYIVIASDEVTNTHQVVLIAPFDGWAARIADDFIPRGWMKTSP